MDDDATPDVASKLCSVCSQLDLERIASGAKLCSKTLNSKGKCSSDEFEFTKKLGTNRHINDRRDECSFCQMIATHLESAYPSSIGYVYLRGSQTMAISSLPPGIIPSKHVHTTTATVEYAYNDTNVPRNWLPGAREEGRIVQLQALYDPSHHDKSREKELLSRIGGRIIDETVDFKLLKTWLHKCETTHNCIRPNTSGPASQSQADHSVMPMYVIDVKEACVVATPPDCRYVALSYVWGKATMLKHLSANSSLLLTPGYLSSKDAPQTIRDSMSVTLAIGEQYLWVDALCIVQDDPAMQASQIAKMDGIYAGATLTIVAGYGDNADAGLPGLRSRCGDYRQEVLRLQNHTFLTVVGGYLVREINHGAPDGPSIQESTWIGRAWTMQELCFSRRCLVFSDNQVFWRCREVTWSEELALEHMTINNLQILPRSLEDNIPTEKVTPARYFHLYCNYLRQYRNRNLSFSSDLVNAFSGITSAFAKAQGDKYFWGHPRSLFSGSLGWFFQFKHTRNFACQRVVTANGQTCDISFPSWSWAAWNATPNMNDEGENLDFWSSRSLSRYLTKPKKPHLPITKFSICDEEGQLILIDEISYDPDANGNANASANTNAVPSFDHLAWQGSEWDIFKGIRDHYHGEKLSPGTLCFWGSVARLNVTSGSNPHGEDDEDSLDDKDDDDDDQSFGEVDDQSLHEETDEQRIDEEYDRSDNDERNYARGDFDSGDDNASDIIIDWGGNQNDACEVWLGTSPNWRFRYHRRIVLPQEENQPKNMFPLDFVAVYREEKSNQRANLMLLALEWKDGVAYRVGLAEISEKAWVLLEKEWRFIVLG